MSGYLFALTCQKCGGETIEIARGSGRYSWQQVAHVRCAGKCAWHGVVTVTLSDVTPTGAKSGRRVP